MTVFLFSELSAVDGDLRFYTCK